MKITNKLKERFCNDCNIPIKIFEEPYFMDRLELLDDLYGTLNKWNLFLEELKKYNSEQDYFEEYNRVKDEAINCIKNSEAYQKFNEEDMNKYRITHTNLPSKDIFHPSNDGKTFISIDMKKANFSALQYYGDSIFKSMFAGASTWEDFISLFTDNKHIINSKYVRQVILGNCNAKRHITYEKYLMDNVLIALYGYISKERVVFFSNDEIIYDVTTFSNISALLKSVVHSIERTLYRRVSIPLKVELFKLHKINGTNGYYKEIFTENNKTEIELKCVNNYMIPFIIRKLKGEDITDNDKVFYHEGLLAKFIETPEIEV